VLCLIALPLRQGKNPFAVKIIDDDDDDDDNNMLRIPRPV
jgi:hypothetical protein